MNPVSEDIIDYMESSAGGLDFTAGTDIFIGVMPDSPDNCVCIIDAGGYAPQPNYTYLRPSFQVSVRGSRQGYQDAWDDAQTIRDALHGVAGETINSTYYSQILATSDIMFVGNDDNDRPLFIINFEAHRY